MVTKVVAPTSTLSHHNKFLGYDRHHLPFKTVEAEEYIEHVSNKEEEEEGMKYDRGRVIASHNVELANVST